MVRRGILGVTAAWAAWRFVSRVLHRYATMRAQHARARRQMHAAWQHVSERIDIMAALAEPPPRHTAAPASSDVAGGELVSRSGHGAESRLLP